MRSVNEVLRNARAALIRARNNGVDGADYLNRYGLLLTDQETAKIHADMCGEVEALIGKLSVAQLVGNQYHGGGASLEDLRQGILRLVNGMRVEAAKGKYVNREGN